MPQAEASSLSDVLNKLPSVNVDQNGSVTVRGGSVQILIDGKSSAALRGASLATTLQSMPAGTVEKIEVITNPGAEFRTDATAVINIVTKRGHRGDLNGDLVVNAASKGRANVSLLGSVTIGKWTLNGTLSGRQDLHYSRSTIDREGLAPADGSVINHMLENASILLRSRVKSADAGATYAVSDRDTLNLSGRLFDLNGHQRIEDGIVFLYPSGTPQSDTASDARGPMSFNNVALTGTWKHLGRREGENFTLIARHEEIKNRTDMDFLDTQDLPVVSSKAYFRRHANRQLADELKGDYVLPLAQDTQFKAGFDAESDRSQTNNVGANFNPAGGVDPLDPVFTDRFLSNQILTAAYIDYQQPFGKWLIDGGLRVENLTTKLGELRATLASVASNVQWSPSLFISRELTPRSKIKFTYSRHVDRPSTDQLDPSPQQLSTEELLVGNPLLRPSQVDSFETGYDYTTKPVTFSGTAYFRQTRGTITGYSYFSDPGDTLLIASYENAGKGSRKGLDLSLDLHLSPKVSYSLNTDLYHFEQTAPVEGVAVRRSILSHLTKLTITITPSAPDEFQVTGVLNGPDLAADGRIHPFNSIDLSYVHKFSSRLKLVIASNNVLGSVRHIEVDRTTRLLSRDVWRPKDDTTFIGLDYKFGTDGSQ